MGRELRRKEERKNKNRKVQMKEQLDTSIKGSTIIKLVVFVALLLFILWFVIAVFITKEIDISEGKDETNTSETTNTTSVSNRILASATFNQKEEVYYVYYYDFTDEDEAIASAISDKSDLKIYRVDTSSSLNQNYVTEEEGNKNITGIDNLKVKNPTILQITNDQVTAYYEGSSSILSFLNQ